MAQRVAPVRRRSTTVTATTTTGGGTAAIATTALAKDYGGALALAPLDLYVTAGQRVS
jgi:hypothetical protein